MLIPSLERSSDKPKIAIGIPTLNRADLLKENLDDLSKNLSDVTKIIIVDNGTQIFDIPPNLKEITYIHTPGKNLGVAASWNYMMQKVFKSYGCDHILMLNDDIVFGRTFEELMDLIDKYGHFYITVGAYYWSQFIMSKECYNVIGKFDEAFFPAYFEDNDYYYRIQLSGDVEKKFNNMLGDFVPTVRRNSMTLKKDKEVNKNFNVNKKHFHDKWGGPPMKEKFTKPFNKE